MSVQDAVTRNVIAERHFREREKDVSFTGNFGILVEITKNVVDAGSNDMLDDAFPEFAAAVKVRIDNWSMVLGLAHKLQSTQVPLHGAALPARWMTPSAFAVVVSMALSGCASTSDKLQTAAERGDAGRVVRLLETGADPSHALDDAARAGHPGIVRILLEAGADPSGALDDAAQAGHPGIVRTLLEAGAQPSDGLDDAARAGHPGIVRILLEAGADPSRGLDDAAWAKQVEIVRILLDAGADPSVGLPAAAGQGHREIVQTLLEAGADPSVGLSAAARWGRTETVAVLLEAGGDPNSTRWVYGSRLSLTPLHGAAWRGHLASAELLIEAGADTKARARYKTVGLTETIGAVFASSLIPFVSPDDLLNIELEDMDGWTPLQFASAAGHTEIAELLTDASEDVAVPAAAGKATENHVALSGSYAGGLWIALDSSGTVTGRYNSYRAGLGTVEQPQFSCAFSFYGFPAGEGEEYLIASWDPPVWRPDSAVEEGINSTGTLSVVEGSAVIQFVDDPSGGCWNVAPFRQGTRFRLRESRAWSQVRIVARDARLLVSPGGAAQSEPPLKRGELTLVLEERDGWFLVEVERVGPVHNDGSDQRIQRIRGWLSEPALFPISPPGAPSRSELERLSGPYG